MNKKVIRLLKRLPGLRQLVTERDHWRDAFAEIQIDATHLEHDRARLRSAMSSARLDPADWQPAYIQNKRADRSRRSWEEFLAACRDLGGLAPDSSVLDVGCGVGGMSQQFAQFLGSGGSYAGIDVDPRAIAVCNATIQRDGFRFCTVDVRNVEYNPAGRVAAEEFAFPFDDATFDLVIGRSLFTHMYPSGAERYVAEIARLLRPGGRALLTAFLINDRIAARLAAGEQVSPRTFRHDRGTYRVEDEERPLMAVAFAEEFLRTMIERSALDIVEPIHFGRWSGEKAYLDHQDLVVLTRPTLPATP